MHKAPFLVQKLITILLLFRSYLKEIPLWLYILLIIALFVYKYFKEGNNFLIIFYISGAISIFTGQIFLQNYLYLFGMVLLLIANFIPLQIYTLPLVKPLVGFSQDVLLTGQYYCRFFPLKQNPKPLVFYLKWNHTIQWEKLYNHAKKICSFPIFKFLTSYITMNKIYLGIGQEKQTDQLIVFSHGRGATPFFYSQLLTNLAQKRKVIAVQHNQAQDTGLSKIEEIKIYRQKQVQRRGKQIIDLIKAQGKQYSKIILMGHSYGCATIIQAYHTIKKQSIESKIQKIVLLDPWFFPLTQQIFKSKFQHQVLMLANQYFIHNEDVFKRNKQFLQIHSPTYLCWKDGDHLHQCDAPWVVGSNPIRKIRFVQKTQEMHQKNIKAIELFLNSIQQSKILQEYKQDILDKNYKPNKLVNELKY